MAEDTLLCPHCRCLSASGRFCESCGKGLDEPPSPAESPAESPVDDAPADVAVDVEAAAEAIEIRDEPVVERNVVAEALRDLIGDTPIPMPQVAATTSAPVEVGSPSECPDLRVEYNFSKLFVVGMTSTFDLAITPLVDGLGRFRVHIVMEDSAGVHSQRKNITVRPSRGSRFDARINYCPQDVFGSVNFTVYIGYQKGESYLWFERETKHKIYPPEARAQDVIENVIVNIHNEMNIDKSTVIRPQLTGAVEELDRLRSRINANTPVRELIDQIDRLQPDTELGLFPSGYEPDEHEPQKPWSAALGVAPEAARSARWTLQSGERRIQLLSKRELQVGKHRECDLVARLFDSSGRATESLNDRISRFHCRIEFHGERCFVVDRGHQKDGSDRASMCGTYVDGDRIAAGQNFELKLHRPCELALGGGRPGDPCAFRVAASLWSCSGGNSNDCPLRGSCTSGSPSCLVLTRKDRIAESYVAVWKCAPMGAADPALEGLRIWREQDAFAYRLGKQTGWLREGVELNVGGSAWRVGRHAQWGL